MKNNYYEKGLVTFVLILGMISGYFLYSKFGFIGIIILIAISYLFLIFLPDLFTKYSRRNSEGESK